jgi:hypothetical protein
VLYQHHLVELSAPHRFGDEVGEERTRFKLVKAEASQDGSHSQHPHQSGLYLWHPISWEVVDNARLETNVRVDKDGSTEQ